ncbi:mechanosensitive ion channel family protein [Hyunsoonleella pacifica]|uniref:Mechanosensitive ion channel family protein n=1 Tax=Hyunsoonleella pacifica TaxID=1080224 RepID=A0A4Q9FY21_9FLAO|nr:mechanosensitive ion channel family protein [Hyunsoonleella pacifica]TBN19112.1 mechanosensitive ion channel family protein [Hyunsoonleella pacifica]GGD07401.1 mechanosensitive ion channel protein MscS [Hyunsoonleella pacifica]
MIANFFETHQTELIRTGFLIGILLIIGSVTNILIKKIGSKSGINDARIRLMRRYVTVSLLLIGILIECFVLGAKFEDIAVIFSSIFAIIGIALFAIWSILSNVTSGIIMFFNFPYKVGDKIEIHDKDFPIKAIIEDIRAFQLHLRLDNGDLVTYPNNLMLQKAVTLVEKDAIDSDSNDDGADIV